MSFSIKNTLKAYIVTLRGANANIYNSSYIQSLPVSPEIYSTVNTGDTLVWNGSIWIVGPGGGGGGTTGYTGYTGPKGDPGDTRYTGATGYTGYTGYTGPKGDSGEASSTGATGYTGYTGPAGFADPIGYVVLGYKWSSPSGYTGWGDGFSGANISATGSINNGIISITGSSQFKIPINIISYGNVFGNDGSTVVGTTINNGLAPQNIQVYTKPKSYTTNTTDFVYITPISLSKLGVIGAPSPPFTTPGILPTTGTHEVAYIYMY